MDEQPKRGRGRPKGIPKTGGATAKYGTPKTNYTMRVTDDVKAFLMEHGGGDTIEKQVRADPAFLEWLKKRSSSL